MWCKSAVSFSCGFLVAACRIRSTACDTLSRPCVRYVLWSCEFPLVEALPSSSSAGAVAPLFAAFIGVGSEEARPAGAGLRPPLKRYVRFSRIPLSRRRLHEDRWRNQRVDPSQPVGKFSCMSGYFTHGTVHLSALAHLILRRPPSTRLPPPDGHAAFTAPGTIRPSGRALRSRMPRRHPRTRRGLPPQSSIPSANTLVRWVDEIAFASVVQARAPPLADRFVMGSPPPTARFSANPSDPTSPWQPSITSPVPAMRPARHSLDTAPLIRGPEGLQPS